MEINFISEIWTGVRCAFQKPVTLSKDTILKKSQNYSKLCIDANKCIKCKSCMFVCPNRCIQIIDGSMQNCHFMWDETKCANCRLCERSCPKKAIRWVKVPDSQDVLY